ncbi:MAG: C39 family peptidase [Planctomycetia bacterium]|nr:C39 family peptidase [Planctomycetia bacterium]
MQKIMFVAAVWFLSYGPHSAVCETVDSKPSGFDRILERVVQRDESSDAIVTISALDDAPDPTAKLVMTIKPLGKSNNVQVELRDSRDQSAIYESYRFRSSPKLNAEAEKLKKEKLTPRSSNAKSKHVLLKVEHVRQGKNLCAPASASMVLKYYGKQVSQDEIKRLANSVAKNPEFAGTYYIDIVKSLKTTGVEWIHREYKADSVGFEAGMTDIIKSLDEGHPVIVDTKMPPDGHTLVVNGYDPNRKQISLVDPLIPAPGIRFVTYAEFVDLWQSLTVNTRGAIFTQPPAK